MSGLNEILIFCISFILVYFIYSRFYVSGNSFINISKKIDVIIFIKKLIIAFLLSGLISFENNINIFIAIGLVIINYIFLKYMKEGLNYVNIEVYRAMQIGIILELFFLFYILSY